MNICPIMVENRHPNPLQLFSWVLKCSLPKMKRTLLQVGLLLAAGITFYQLCVRTISQKLNIKNVNIHNGQLFWIWRTSASVGQGLTVWEIFFIQKECSWCFLQGLLISVAIASLSTNTLSYSVIVVSCECTSSCSQELLAFTLKAEIVFYHCCSKSDMERQKQVLEAILVFSWWSSILSGTSGLEEFCMTKAVCWASQSPNRTTVVSQI